MRPFLIALLVWCSLAPAAPCLAAAAPAYPELAAARRAGWDVARTIASGMAAADLKRFPGVQAWLKEFRTVEAKFDATTASASPPAFDVDRLVTRNPAWWLAYFEIAPADPPALLLQAGLLLAAGEASRASYVLVVARQRTGMADGMRDALETLLGHSQRALARAGRAVHEAGKQADDGARQAAVAKLRETLLLWPQSGLAHYELALAALGQQYIAAGRKPPTRAQLNLHSELKPSTEVLAGFARARQHDPLLLPAYQGPEAQIGEALLVLGRKVRPFWEAVAKDSAGEAPDDTLRILGSGLQEAGLDELAVTARQVVVARERGYDDADRRFLAASLRKLLPEAGAEAAMRRLGIPGIEYLSLVLRP